MREDQEAEEPGTVLRPEATILPDEALIPATHIVRPPPNHFTHRLAGNEPYRFDRPPAADPDGVLAAGTPVVLLVDGQELCRVVDPEGRYVEVRRASLRPLS